MSSISGVLIAAHRDCDALFTVVVQAVERGQWSAGREGIAAFSRSLERHIDIEEQVLFPAFVQTTGVIDGPTRVLGHEHRQILAMLDGIAAAVGAHDAARFGEMARSFTELMKSHNAKEETVLYPICDQVLRRFSGEQLSQMVPRP